MPETSSIHSLVLIEVRLVTERQTYTDGHRAIAYTAVAWRRAVTIIRIKQLQYQNVANSCLECTEDGRVAPEPAGGACVPTQTRGCNGGLNSKRRERRGRTGSLLIRGARKWVGHRPTSQGDRWEGSDERGVGKDGEFTIKNQGE